MIDNCCGNNVYQKTQHGGIPADEYEDCKVYNEIKSDQYVGNTVVFSGFVVNLMNNNIGEDFRASIQPPFLRIRESPIPRIAPPNATARKCSVFNSNGIFSK